MRSKTITCDALSRRAPKMSIAIRADDPTFEKYIVELQSQKNNLYLRTPYAHFVRNDTITEKLFLCIVGK